MSGSTLGIVLIVIVAAAGLTVWLAAVFRAERHPEAGGRGGAPRRKITGGIFRGATRQQMPRRDAPAEVISTDGEPGRGE
jgi:hypothetical protein